MAIVRIPEKGLIVTDPSAASALMTASGIESERWEVLDAPPPEASSAEILAAYAGALGILEREAGAVTADVIDVHPGTPGLDEMLARFEKEHWHDEDEVRFVLAGRGLFHVRPAEGPVMAIEVCPGDLIRVPKGTRHWFHLCAERRIRAIRLFRDPAGWVPHYTGSGVEGGFQPVCLGPSDLPPLPFSP